MIIGGHNPFYCCIEYNFVANTLKTKSFDFDAKARPMLKYANLHLYSLSGHNGDDYCCDFDMYDKFEDLWLRMPPLPSAHYNGCVYTLPRKTPCLKYKTVKHDLYLIGGCTSARRAQNFNPAISKFDFELFKWETFQIEKMFGLLKVPKLIGYATIQVDSDSVIFLGESKTGSCYLNSNN